MAWATPKLGKKTAASPGRDPPRHGSTRLDFVLDRLATVEFSPAGRYAGDLSTIIQLSWKPAGKVIPWDSSSAA
jgi:hypothetical protein